MAREVTMNEKLVEPRPRKVPAELEPGDPEALRVKVLVVLVGTVLVLGSVVIAGAVGPVAG